MYIIKAEGFTGPFNGEYYSDQYRANDEAKRLANRYNAPMTVCKVVEISVFRPTEFTLEEAHAVLCDC
jgi:hypothetical protein